MKPLLFLVIFLFFCFTISCGSLRIFAKNSSLLSHAIRKVLREVMVKRSSTLNVITPDNASATVNDFANDLLSESFDLAVSLESSSSITAIQGSRKSCTIFIIENLKEFLQAYEKITPNIFKLSGFYLIIVVNGKIPELKTLFELLWSIQIYNVNVIYHTNSDSIHVKSFMPFNIRNCNDTTPKLINHFANGSFTNDIEKFFPDKFVDMRGCSIRVATSNTSKPSVFAIKNSNKTFQLKGEVINLITTLAENMKFKINYTFIGPERFFSENGAGDGPLKALYERQADVAVNSWYLKAYRLKFFDSTVSHISDQFILVVPPGRELTPFEKLIYPFTLQVWILIAVVLLVGSLVIFVVSQQTEKARNFVFGEGVTTPYLNLFSGFVGGAQNILPKGSFARFLLTLLFVQSLVIRTLYQGSYYNILQSNKKHREVQSIDEMIRENFQFFISNSNEDLFQEIKQMENR